MIHIVAENQATAKRHIAHQVLDPDDVTVVKPTAKACDVDFTEVHVVGDIPLTAVNTILRSLTRNRGVLRYFP